MCKYSIFLSCIQEQECKCFSAYKHRKVPYEEGKENLSTLESTVIYFSLWRRWLYVYFLNSSLDIVAKK